VAIVVQNSPIALRMGNRSCVKYHISQYAYTDNFFNKH